LELLGRNGFNELVSTRPVFKGPEYVHLRDITKANRLFYFMSVADENKKKYDKYVSK